MGGQRCRLVACLVAFSLWCSFPLRPDTDFLLSEMWARPEESSESIISRYQRACLL